MTMDILKIERLKHIRQVNDVVTCISNDVALQKQSCMKYTGICPFCKKDKIYIHTTFQVFKCAGCGVKGDVISYIKLKHNCDLNEALEILEDDNDTAFI